MSSEHLEMITVLQVWFFCVQAPQWFPERQCSSGFGPLGLKGTS